MVSPSLNPWRTLTPPWLQARSKQTARMPSPDTRLRRVLARPALPAMATKSAQSYAAFSFAAQRGRAERRRSDNDSGSGSNSNSGNDSASNSDSASVEIIENDDSDSVENIDDDEKDENDENEPDVVVLGTASASSASSSTKRHVKYLKRYNLLLPPVDPELSHERRARIVRRYFTHAPRLDDPEGLQIRLFRRVFEDTRRNPNWAAEEDCSVCLNASAPAPQIVLSCACRTRLFHINCIRGWHEQDDAAVQNLIRSTQVLHASKVTPSAAEAAAKKQKRKQARRAKARAKRSNEKQASKSGKAKVVRKAGKDAKMREEAAPGPEHPATGATGAEATAAGTSAALGNGVEVAPRLFLHGAVLHYRK
ncbi:hypothetical protein B0H14DRAFT_2632097 [Mycena olivaceomarginata]|nr:hypothetical protein B0H14DRAFT_2632097 [Mycena olivaceomarginata]